MIIFRPDLGTSFNFLRQPPRNVQCSEWSQAETELRFFNLKVWAIVSLSQAVVWGAVFFIAVRWLAGLAMTGASEGRWARVVKVAGCFLALSFFSMVFSHPHTFLGPEMLFGPRDRSQFWSAWVFGRGSSGSGYVGPGEPGCRSGRGDPPWRRPAISRATAKAADSARHGEFCPGLR